MRTVELFVVHGCGCLLLAVIAAELVGQEQPIAPASQVDIPELVSRLQDVEEGDIGYMPSRSGSSFLPLGTSEPGTMVLSRNAPVPARAPVTSSVMRELVARGQASVPHLLAHLDDKRPTKLKVEHHSFDGGMHLADEYDYNRHTVLQPPQGVNTREERGHLRSYTVTVGDLCFVALGQIVNRKFSAVRYQPTSIIVVNSRTSTTRLLEVIRTEWGGLTMEQHKASLVRDFLEPDYEERRLDACLRLRCYYPDILESLVLNQLTAPRRHAVDRSAPPEPFTENDRSLFRLIQFVALYPSAPYDAAVRDILRSTDSDGLAVDCAKFLESRGADPDIQRCFEQHRGDLQQAYEEENRIRRQNRAGGTPLHVAADVNLPGNIDDVIASGVDVNARAANGQTPLHVAAEHASYWALRALLKAQANPNIKDGQGRTPLTLAFNHEAAADMLLARGAIPSDILEAAYAGRADLVATFLNEDRSAVSARTPDGETPLHLAARRGHLDTVKLLLTAGAALNAVDNDGRQITPFHWAAGFAGPEMVTLLLEHNADRSAKTWDNRTPLDFACDNRNEAVCRLLRGLK